MPKFWLVLLVFALHQSAFAQPVPEGEEVYAPQPALVPAEEAGTSPDPSVQLMPQSEAISADQVEAQSQGAPLEKSTPQNPEEDSQATAGENTDSVPVQEPEFDESMLSPRTDDRGVPTSEGSVSDIVDQPQEIRDNLVDDTVAQELSIGAYVQVFSAVDDRSNPDLDNDSVPDKSLRTNILEFSPTMRYTFDGETEFAGKISFRSGGPENHSGGDSQQGSAKVEYAHITHLLSERDLDFLKLRVGHQYIPIGINNPDPNPLKRYTVGLPELETELLPENWHENGVLLMGSYQYLDYSFGIFNSIDAEKFSSVGSSRRFVNDAVQNGQNAESDHVMATLRLDYELLNQQLGASVVHGNGSQDSGIEKAKLTLWEIHALLKHRWVDLRLVFAQGHYSDASQVAGPTFFEQANGFYGTIAFDLLRESKFKGKLPLFVRHSRYNLHDKVSITAVADPSLHRTRTTIGFNYFPRNEIVYKAHYTLRKNEENEEDDLVEFGAAVVF